MARTLEFFFDYGSPYSYLADTQVEAIAGRAGAALERKPMLLGGVFKATGNRSPMEAFGGIRNKLAYERLETQRFIADPMIFSEVCEVVCDAVYDMLYNDGFLDLPSDWRARLQARG